MTNKKPHKLTQEVLILWEKHKNVKNILEEIHPKIKSLCTIYKILKEAGVNVKAQKENLICDMWAEGKKQAEIIAKVLEETGEKICNATITYYVNKNNVNKEHIIKYRVLSIVDKRKKEKKTFAQIADEIGQSEAQTIRDYNNRGKYLICP